MGDGKVIEPRQELDALVAEKVMGDYHFETARLVSGRAFWWKHDGEIMESPPPYSTDIATAWKVMDKLVALGWSPGVEWIHGSREAPWRCDLYSPSDGMMEDAFAATAPLAICLAALAAVGDPAHVR